MGMLLYLLCSFSKQRGKKATLHQDELKNLQHILSGKLGWIYISLKNQKNLNRAIRFFHSNQ